jgi:hypothetical protein
VEYRVIEKKRLLSKKEADEVVGEDVLHREPDITEPAVVVDADTGEPVVGYLPMERELTARLRAAVMGANDGIVSTASLMIGVTAAVPDESGFIITAGVAGIVAGAMSMAVGEYVSVRSQNDVEDSDRHLEIEHLAIDPEGELLE